MSLADSDKDVDERDPRFSLSRVRLTKSDHPAFGEMVRLARALPMTSFQKDVTFWDRRALLAPKTKCFAWCLRPCGATILWHGCKVRVEPDLGDCFWWDGARLLKCSPDDLTRLLRMVPCCAEPRIRVGHCDNCGRWEVDEARL